jgi:hypothetical protein
MSSTNTASKVNREIPLETRLDLHKTNHERLSCNV